MAIQSNKLALRFEGDLDAERLTLYWQVFHTDWTPDTVVASGNVSANMPDLAQIADVDAGLQEQLRDRLQDVRQLHKPLAVVGNQSLHDVGLIWDGWQFHPLADGRWQADHPVSGTFTGQMENTPVGRTEGILTVVLPPPAWAWADSPGAGQLRVKCVAVTGATGYAVYDQQGDTYTHLGDVPNAGLNTLAVDAGTYNVRVAALNDEVGVLSIATVVTVG